MRLAQLCAPHLLGNVLPLLLLHQLGNVLYQHLDFANLSELIQPLDNTVNVRMGTQANQTLSESREDIRAAWNAAGKSLNLLML